MLTYRKCHWATVRGGYGTCIHPKYNTTIIKLRDTYTDPISNTVAYRCPKDCSYYISKEEANEIIANI